MRQAPVADFHVQIGLNRFRVPAPISRQFRPVFSCALDAWHAHDRIARKNGGRKQRKRAISTADADTVDCVSALGENLSQCAVRRFPRFSSFSSPRRLAPHFSPPAACALLHCTWEVATCVSSTAPSAAGAKVRHPPCIASAALRKSNGRSWLFWRPRECWGAWRSNGPGQY